MNESCETLSESNDSALTRSNADWIKSLRDPKRREAAIEDLSPLLLRGLAKSLGSKITLPLEDVVQESLLKILAGLDRFRGECRFTSWALTIAIRCGISELRKRHYRDVSFFKLVDDGHSIEPSFIHDSIERRLDREVIKGQLNQLIETKLGSRQQAAVRGMLMGMSVEGIAKKLGSNRNAVYKLIHDARSRLRAGLDEARLDRRAMSVNGMSAH